MRVFLVGGAVRDQLLGLPVKDRDYLVVGATAQQMLDAGYTQVGADFPVFLDGAGQEFALARRERKVAPGYAGFACDFAPDVSAEDDLLRRDLTINAMAQDPDGQLIDPFGGQRDLHARVLRHVSPAFAEDPVRVLRVARLLARYAPLGFTVAPETMALMSLMVAAGDVAHLVPERVWKEVSRALLEPRPDLFLRCLHDVGALAVIMPEVDAIYGVPQPPDHHPEVDTGVHIELVLRWLSERHPDAPLAVRFAALAHDLGKGNTPAASLPRHIGHEDRGIPLVQSLCHRLRAPNDIAWFAEAVCRYHTHAHRALGLRAGTLVDLMQSLGAFKAHSAHWLPQFALVCHADAAGRTGLQDTAYPQAAYLVAATAAANAVSSAETAQRVMAKGAKGEAVGAAVRQARVEAVAAFVGQYRSACA